MENRLNLDFLKIEFRKLYTEAKNIFDYKGKDIMRKRSRKRRKTITIFFVIIIIITLITSASPGQPEERSEKRGHQYS